MASLYKPGEFNPLIEAATAYFIAVRRQHPEVARSNAIVWYSLYQNRFVSGTGDESASCSFWPDDEKDNRVSQ